MSATTFAPDFGDDKAEPIDHSKNIQLHQKENRRAITITQNAARSFRFAVLLLVCIKPIQEQNNGKMHQLQKQ